ncbi:type II toxin-antitoxin system RelE/ParE family toxin [Marinomonas sp. A79]|uniref:Type II toxin-antitoxin system RelE/ParE family toxin n=1 Tax=Marinomonas vulgaris TaxID=2823372 RepID=A0ABS5HBU0_9GAMM|nr:type II toxin-antitoxin system RelE/ParE family toxin [Marinomonas vulgaris]MBR7888892.1 type II toxin-antitoxin system RelE/ParE family toxin [Marinomonas vulgaris]
MKVYVTDDFLVFMKRAKLIDAKVAAAAKELSFGLHDGELVPNKSFKKRIASLKQSKRDSNRSIVAVKLHERMIFIAGWRKADIPKKGKEIPDKLLEAYKLFAEDLLTMSEQKMAEIIEAGLLKEVSYEG